MAHSDLADLETVITRIVDARIEKALGQRDPDPLIDQAMSPLGKRRHLSEFRAGRLHGSRIGKKVLVRQSEIDRYVAEHVVVIAAPRPEPEEPADEMVTAMRKAARGGR